MALYTFGAKKFVYIAITHTTSEINAFLHFMQTFKMATENGGDMRDTWYFPFYVNA